MNEHFPWLRWWDTQGNLLPHSDERTEREQARAEMEKQRADERQHRAEQERQRAERLMERLRALGVRPEDI